MQAVLRSHQKRFRSPDHSRAPQCNQREHRSRRMQSGRKARRRADYLRVSRRKRLPGERARMNPLGREPALGRSRLTWKQCPTPGLMRRAGLESPRRLKVNDLLFLPRLPSRWPQSKRTRGTRCRLLYAESKRRWQDRSSRNHSAGGGQSHPSTSTSTSSGSTSRARSLPTTARTSCGCSKSSAKRRQSKSSNCATANDSGTSTNSWTLAGIRILASSRLTSRSTSASGKRWRNT